MAEEEPNFSLSRLAGEKIQECKWIGPCTGLSTLGIGYVTTDNLEPRKIRFLSLIPIIILACGVGFYMNHACKTNTQTFFEPFIDAQRRKELKKLESL